MKQFKTLLGLTAICAGLFGISSCAVNDEWNYEVAHRLAAPAQMIERPIEVGPFVLTSFERMYERGEPATLYIAAEDNNEAIHSGALYNPTPKNPVGLHLASKDKADNLAYLARPCQYSGLSIKDGDCNNYWGVNKYNPEVLAALNEAMDGMKKRYSITSFHLVGYDDAATIVSLLAVDRSDVLSIRTVAGEFDEEVLSPIMPQLCNVPQHHFTGGQDQVTPSAHLQEHLQKLGQCDCVDHTFIQEASHDAGWVDKWPELLKSGTPKCYVAPEPDFQLIDTPEPIYSPRIGIEKK